MVHVDDIIINGRDHDDIVDLKQAFQTKDLGQLRYFLQIETATSKQGIYLSQRKYVMNLLEESGMLEYKLFFFFEEFGYKHIDSPMDSNVQIGIDEGELLPDPSRYRRMVGKLIYLILTQPNIVFSVGVVSQSMHTPHQPHWDVVCRIQR